MSEQIVRRAERIVDAQSALPWLVAVGVYALLTAVGPKLLSDPDTYSHIALGRWILEHGAVPTTDPFSSHVARNPLGCIRVALAGRVCDGSRGRRLDRRRRSDSSRDGDSIRTLDAISTARVAANCSVDRGFMCDLAHGTAHPGAASHSWASGDRCMDRPVDPRRCHAQFAPVASASTDDTVGQPARQLYVWSRNDRAHRLRCAVARAATGATWRRKRAQRKCATVRNVTMIISGPYATR